MLLYDTSPSPLAQLLPGERHDFLIRHDIKEVSAYTLICSTSYIGQVHNMKYTLSHSCITILFTTLTLGAGCGCTQCQLVHA